VPGNKINVGVYSLAELPIDYLSRLGCPLEQVCNDQKVAPVYRDVFTSGIKAYQLVTYRNLVREHYGRGVAHQVGTYQQRLLEREPGGHSLGHSVRLINAALDSDTVAADTDQGRMEIPIEMNVALSLLLGADSSPHCVSHPDDRITEISSMDMDVDWVLSRCLSRARENMQNVFMPLLGCINSGVRIDYVEAYLKDRLVVN
jgi:hypothetical protein